MKYLGDFEVGAQIYLYFTTRNPATGEPLDFDGGTCEIQVYKANDVAQTTAGVTKTHNFDSVAGRHLVSIDMDSNPTAVAFYLAKNDYSVVISSGAIGGRNVAGEEIACFSVCNRSNLRLGRTLQGENIESGGPDVGEITDVRFTDAT